jgi:hypothetical protein
MLTFQFGAFDQPPPMDHLRVALKNSRCPLCRRRICVGDFEARDDGACEGCADRREGIE